MKLYRVTCSWDDVDGYPVFWAGTKRDAQRIQNYIFKETETGGCHDGAALGDPEIEEVNVPTDKKGLLAFLQLNAQIDYYPTYPSDVAEVVR